MEVGHRTFGRLTEILYNEKILGCADLRKAIETWLVRMGHLGYPNLLRLNNQAENMDIEGPTPEGICGNYTKGRQQRTPLKIPMTTFTSSHTQRPHVTLTYHSLRR